MASPLDMQPGHRYRIQYQLDNQRKPREAVLDFLGIGRFVDEYDFSARPIAGTQTLKRSTILQVWEVPQSTPIRIGG